MTEVDPNRWGAAALRETERRKEKDLLIKQLAAEIARLREEVARLKSDIAWGNDTHQMGG